MPLSLVLSVPEDFNTITLIGSSWQDHQRYNSIFSVGYGLPRPHPVSHAEGWRGGRPVKGEGKKMWQHVTDGAVP